ncbi:MAG: ATP--guanido phosphotransferase [Verrucomicrobiaceae bacterium]|nr:ATP--guanido phosphotransferase [Verrucomicrobiaceae bacterium]
MVSSKRVRKVNSAIVISSRIRLARNLAGRRFVASATPQQLSEIYVVCANAVLKTKKMRTAKLYNMGEITEYDRAVLSEKRAISKELETSNTTKGAIVSKNGKLSAFINEEDHIRIQVLGDGLSLESLYKTANALDDEIENNLEYAYSSDIGYITSCPTNMGTGMRASVMMHLPALSADYQMEKIVRALNQLGMVVRGANGEGSDSFNAYYQLSNQQTLGISENDIIKKIQTFCKKICQFEINARSKIMEDNPLLLVDKILRARALLENCKLIDTDEALANISALRLAADMNMIDNGEDVIKTLDALSQNILPAHLQECLSVSAESNQRDAIRAKYLNEEIAKLPEIKIGKINY